MLTPKFAQTFVENAAGAQVSFQRPARGTVRKRKASKPKFIVTMDGADDRSSESIDDRRAVYSDPGVDSTTRNARVNIQNVIFDNTLNIRQDESNENLYHKIIKAHVTHSSSPSSSYTVNSQGGFHVESVALDTQSVPLALPRLQRVTPRQQYSSFDIDDKQEKYEIVHPPTSTLARKKSWSSLDDQNFAATMRHKPEDSSYALSLQVCFAIFSVSWVTY
jgi:hypothetical protein